MKKVIHFNPRHGDSQEAFDLAMKEVQAELKKGNECDIMLDTLTGRQMLLVEGFFDIDVTDSFDMITYPHIWYNKKFLDELNIKY